MNIKEVEKEFGVLENKKYICVFDLELTCWDTKDPNFRPKDEMEIIELGILVCDLDLNILHEIQQFVKPVNYPQLSDYCVELTGITQIDVDQFESLEVEIDKLIAFGDLPSPQEFVWACWGSDAFHINAEWQKQTQEEQFFDPRHINIKFHDVKRRGLKRALKSYGIKQVQPVHRALPDAKSALQLMKKMKLDILDCNVSNKKTERQTRLYKQNEMAEKFYKRTGLRVETSLRLLSQLDYDFQKAKNILEILRGDGVLYL